MHFVNHNFTDHDFETKHLNRIEKTIYLDLRSIYLSTEKPIDGSDMDLLQRRLSVTDDAEKQALAFVLKDKFTKAGKLYKHAVWEKIIKDYKFQQISIALGDMTKRLKAAGVTVEANAGMSAIRELYIQRFGGDKLTRITNNANVMTNEANVKANRANDKANVITNEGEYKLTSNDERKFMVDSLKGVGESVTLKTSIATLRELYTKRFNSDSKTDATNAIHQANGMTNTNANPMTNAANAITNEINVENDTITTNHEPETNNQKPVIEDAHTNTGEVIVDKFNHVSVDNSTDDNQPSDSQPVPVEPVAAQPSANQPATKADQIRDQRADDIENWEAPTIDQMRGELFKAGKMIQLTDDQYQFEISAFKAHYAEQALKGNPLTTESYRKVKLIKWMMREADNQKADQARQEKAKGRFSTDNENWGTTGNKGDSNFDSDLPPVYHPSHSAGQPADEYAPLFLNGCKRSHLPGMTTAETEAYVDRYVQSGEARVAAYDRLSREMKEAV
jgi:uncharacterized protein YdaU (DUF1376 family)